MSDTLFTVSQFNRFARSAIERQLPLCWVTGEIANLSRAASGHVYFSLKDEAAQVRCVLFRNRAQLLPFRLENGQRIDLCALPTLYEARGDFQLTVETVRQAGIGALYEAFLRLQEKLAASGLFAAERKRPLPVYPQRIGIVTSPNAAALHDVLAALARRARHVDIVLYPCAVQGEDAPTRIIQALDLARSRQECDVLLLVRGGGGIEDLRAFNDEGVAYAVRAVSESGLPVITGIGHETDLSIADWVADFRAATPTAAAEQASAHWFAVAAELENLSANLPLALRRKLDQCAQTLDLLTPRLKHPLLRWQMVRHRLEHLGFCLHTEMARRIRQQNEAIVTLRLRFSQIKQRLLPPSSARLDNLATQLASLNPHAVLARGYSLVQTLNGQIIRAADQIKPQESLNVVFSRGQAHVVVIATQTG